MAPATSGSHPISELATLFACGYVRLLARKRGLEEPNSCLETSQKPLDSLGPKSLNWGEHMED
jgi:hypothetical protein